MENELTKTYKRLREKSTNLIQRLEVTRVGFRKHLQVNYYDQRGQVAFQHILIVLLRKKKF